MSLCLFQHTHSRDLLIAVGVDSVLHRRDSQEAKIAAANDGNGAAALPPPAKPRRPRRITANSTAVIEIEAELPVCCERFADLAVRTCTWTCLRFAHR